MTNRITLTLPVGIREEMQRIAELQSQSIESLLIDRLQAMILPSDIQSELDALNYLSDDALWTIAREQIPEEIQKRADYLLARNNLGAIDDVEREELKKLTERADKLMLRKAESASILRKRGHHVRQEDFLSDA